SRRRRSLSSVLAGNPPDASTAAIGAALAGAFVAVAARLPLASATCATSEFFLVGRLLAAGGAFVLTLTAFAGAGLTAFPAGFAALTALTGFTGLATALAAGLATLVALAGCFGAGGFVATTATSAFFRTVFDAALAGTLLTASGAPRAVGAGLSRDLLAPARAMNAFLSSGPRASGRSGAARDLERGILPA